MFGIHDYASFVAAIIVFQLIPGPGTLAILNATARNGIGAGMGAVVGTLVGDFVFMLAAVAGLAAVMQANPMLFAALQWFGAGYLCWIGLQLLRARTDATSDDGRAAAIGMALFPAGLRRQPDQSEGRAVLRRLLSALPPARGVRDDADRDDGARHADQLPLPDGPRPRRQCGGAPVARELPSARRIATRAAGVALVAFGVKLAISNR